MFTPRFTAVVVATVIAGFLSVVRAQDIEVEVDPLAYMLKGYSVHGALAEKNLRVDLGVFGIEVPDAIHGNTGMTQFTQGVGLKAQYSFSEDRSGVFVGIGTDYSWTRYGSGGTQTQEAAPSVGVNFGYRFPIGSSGLYVTPWIGLDYTFASKQVAVGTQTFNQSSLRVFPTIHAGWRF